MGESTLSGMTPGTTKPLTPRDVAAQIGISPAAVYELCKAGLIGYRRVGAKGGRLRFEQADVDAYLAATKIEAVPKESMPRSRRESQRQLLGPKRGFSILRAYGWNGKSELNS
jgi:excisionase family DNA binding protein